MSAILETDGALGEDGIRRYHTTCKVRIHSHVNGSFDVSQDVIGIGASKNIKGTGNATVTLVGSHNFLNMVHPNDYINIYINVGDGEGFTRLFFGYVDVIREKYSVDDSGVPTTVYILKCSDFQKAFEKTHIYFNPHMSGREDFGGEQFGTINIGGVALMTKGIQASGSPANVIQNLIMMLFGFGTQFVLPGGYGAGTAVVNDNRTNRRKYLEGELGHIARAALLPDQSFAQLKEEISAEAGGIANDLASIPETDAIKLLESSYGVKVDNIALQDVPRVTRLIADAVFRKRIGAGKGSFNEHDPAVTAAIGALDDTDRYSLLDVIDAFTYFEDESIDGWITDIGIWQKQGPFGQILRSHSHEEINEFFFDLRPVVDDEADESTKYVRTPDEIGGNLGGGVEMDGIQYVPAIIMREYPFGTISRIDASDAQFSLRGLGESGDAAANKSVGVIEVGAMFSDKPNRPGRHVVGQPSLSLGLNATGRAKSAAKHLDVAVIASDEIKAYDLGRSDSDHFNLFEVYAGDFQLNDIKWMMADVLPIVTPIHIMRHGLRVRNYTTRYAQFNIDLVGQVERKNSRASALQAGDVTKALDFLPTVPGEPSSSGGIGVSAEDAELSQALSAVTPVEVSATGNTGKVTSSFGYRTRNSAGRVRPTATVFVEGGSWVHHNGVDIIADVGTPVRAVMDGVVVASVPNGVYSGYGQTVIIKHKPPSGPVVYTQYSHLDSRDVGAHNVSPLRFNGESQDMNSRGTFPPESVTIGQQIGTVGVTAGTSTNPAKKFNVGRAHLHFEYLTGFENRVYPSKDKPRFVDDVEIIAGSAVTPAPGDTTPRCLDPAVQQTAFGAPLDGSGAITEDEEIDDAESSLDDGDNADTEPTQGAGAALNAVQLISALAGDDSNFKTDTATTRGQMLRWGFLQDHWYQHNLEYLSGQITMRGAPEIRVGYRLDIRNTRMSFYVDGVSHNWQFPAPMTTVLTVSRGQSNNPHPMYVMPPMPAFVSNSKEQRGDDTRLSVFQITPDPISVSRAIVFRRSQEGSQYAPGEDRTYSDILDNEPVNRTDLSSFSPTVNNFGGPTGSGRALLESVYGDYVIYPEIESSIEGDIGLSPSLASDLDELFAPGGELSTGLDNLAGQDLEGPNK